MGTAEFWAKDLGEGLEFLASAMVPTAGIGAAGAAVRGGVKSVQAAKRLAAGEKWLTTIFNTVSEAGFEAKHINDEIRDQLAFQQGYVSYDLAPMAIQQAIAQEAGEAAARTF